MVRPVEYRDIRRILAGLEQPGDDRCHPFCLVLLGTGMIHQRLFAATAHGMQSFGIAVGIMSYERIARSYYLGSGAIVGVQHYSSGLGVHLVEIQKQLHIRPAPGIYGLIGIAHNEEIAMAAGKPKPMVPRPPELMKLRDVVNLKYREAIIWF